MKLGKLTIKKYLEMLEKKQITALELIEEMEKRAHKLKHLNMFILDQFTQAKETAKNRPGVIPIGLKDIFLVKGEVATSGSKMLKNFVSPFSATVVDRLLYHNAVSIGKTNMDEFGCGSSGKTSYFGPTISPWKNAKGEDMCPGGSSSGSAAAVASGVCLAATGTDTGNSVRLPAAYTGLVGLKPTYGVFSRYGVIPFANGLDCPGLFTKTVDDCEFLFSKLVGADVNDFTSVDYVAQQTSKKVGVFIHEDTDDFTKTQLLRAAKILEKNGYEIHDVQIDLLEYTIPCYYIMAPAELSSNLSRYNGIFYGDDAIQVSDLNDLYIKTRSECFGEEIQRRIVIGNYMMYCGNMEGFFEKAKKIINRLWKNLCPSLDAFDFILMPCSKGVAPTMQESLDPDPVKMYLGDLYTCFVNQLGIPGLSIPMNLCPQEKMPVGIQMIARPFAENLLFDGAKIIENETQFLEQFGME